MLDDLYKPRMDRFWDAFGRVVARTGVGPNGVTWIAFALSAGNSGLFVLHRDRLAYGISLALVELLDDLDGAVARVSGRSSAYGSYLDATTDRWKELLSLLAVAVVTADWPAAALAIGASLLVSYAHARAAMEGARGTRGFGPDLFQRFERVATLCVGLVASALLPHWKPFGHDALSLALWAIAVLGGLTAVQRFLRARRELQALAPGAARPLPPGAAATSSQAGTPAAKVPVRRWAAHAAGLIHDLHRIRVPFTDRPLLRLDTGALESMLLDIHEVFAAHQLLFWLRDGTALGVIRDGALIPHDDDVDLGLWAHDHETLERALPELARRGFVLYKRTSNVYALLRDRETVELVLNDLTGEQIPYQQVLVRFFRELGSVEFRGREFRVPRQAERYLEFSYGADWRTPKRWAFWSNTWWLPAAERERVVEQFRGDSLR